MFPYLSSNYLTFSNLSTPRARSLAAGGKVELAPRRLGIDMGDFLVSKKIFVKSFNVRVTNRDLKMSLEDGK